MNKAFVKESDDEPLSTLPEMPAGVRNYITPHGYQNMQTELRNLLGSLRAANAADSDERDKNLTADSSVIPTREIEQRIHYLQARLDTAEIVDPSVHIDEQQIYFGATVAYQNEQGEDHTLTFVCLDELVPTNCKISWLSPVAQSLLSAFEGDSVVLQTPAGDEELHILSVFYPAKVELDANSGGLTNKSVE